MCIRDSLYTVEIPEDNGMNYLYWDRPVSAEQQGKIFLQLRKERFFFPEATAEFWSGRSHVWNSGKEFYGFLDYMFMKDVYKRQDSPDVVFLIDPPYMATDISTYRMDWKLTDYLDVLLVLKGHPFVYFTSGKSPILDFCRWMEEHPETGNPFKGAGMSTLTARMNYSSSYTDIMLYKETTEAA